MSAGLTNPDGPETGVLQPDDIPDSCVLGGVCVLFFLKKAIGCIPFGKFNLYGGLTNKILNNKNKYE